MEKEKNDSCDNNCSLFDFMANTAGIKVLHPGGYEATEKICSLSNLNENSNVLDLACGAGTTSFYLSKKYKCRINGIDISKSLIADANKSLKKSGKKNKINFEVGNALNLPYPDNTFDFVISQAFFILIDDRQKALNEIYRVLKPGGFLGSLELGWFKTPPKDFYDEILKKTCTNFVPRMVKFEEWEDFFRSENLNLIKTIKNPMTSGMFQMIKIEGLINFISIMFKMITQSKTRKRMLEVQKTFGKYDDYIGYGLFVLIK
jgi:ubiquinone/menaquinone biosynthesis C-methylase UbiE